MEFKDNSLSDLTWVEKKTKKQKRVGMSSLFKLFCRTKNMFTRHFKVTKNAKDVLVNTTYKTSSNLGQHVISEDHISIV